MTARAAIAKLTRRRAGRPGMAEGFGPVVGCDAWRGKPRADLDGLLRAARERYEAMSPYEKAAMHAAQRESWARGMGPCEHGVCDYEDCADCRAAARRHPEPVAGPPLDYAAGCADPGDDRSLVTPPWFTPWEIVLLTSLVALGALAILFGVVRP